MCNILHVHRMPKTPESVDMQRKTSNLNGLLVLFLWQGMRDSNSPHNEQKR
nr:MAG TPA: hypothetical protein [Caudoviricetes sp.]